MLNVDDGYSLRVAGVRYGVEHVSRPVDAEPGISYPVAKLHPRFGAPIPVYATARGLVARGFSGGRLVARGGSLKWERAR